MKKIIVIFVLLLAMPLYSEELIDYDFDNEQWGVLSNGSDWSIDSTGGVDGSPAIKVHNYPPGGLGGRELLLNVLPYTSNVWWIEMDVKIVGTMTGGMKFIKFFGSRTTPSQNNITLGHTYGGNQMFSPAYYIDSICDPFTGGSNHDIWFDGDIGVSGSNSCSVYRELDGETLDFRGGGWHHFKTMVNRADPGQADGENKVWLDEVFVGHLTAMKSNPGTVENSDGFQTISFGDYVANQGDSDPISTSWYMVIDNLYVGTTEKNVVEAVGHKFSVFGDIVVDSLGRQFISPE